MTTATILCDSINTSNKKRLTTFLLHYPRIIHAEHLRHRVFSFSVQSTRAIPVKKMLEMVKSEPFIPTYWGKNQAGMQAYEQLNDIEKETITTLDENGGGFWRHPCLVSEKEAAKRIWLESRNLAIQQVEKLEKLGLHKQLCSRLLEPWLYINVLCSGTNFENFFALRSHPAAQPEIKELSDLMLAEYNKSTPREISPLGAWLANEDDKLNKYLEDINNHHVPFGDEMPEATTKEKLMISCARAARLSYNTFDGEINKDKDIELYNKLVTGNHMSALEHTAYPVDNTQNYGNFVGWVQLRKTFENECLRDNRVIQK
jgi:thymidylate synthase ThyX